MNTIPIIRLEVERMKHAIMSALPEHAAMMDESVRQAIEAYCTPDNIGAVVQSAVQQHLDAAVKEEVRNFFQWSKPGRQAVREAVIDYLNAWDQQRNDRKEGTL